MANTAEISDSVKACKSKLKMQEIAELSSESIETELYQASSDSDSPDELQINGRINDSSFKERTLL